MPPAKKVKDTAVVSPGRKKKSLFESSRTMLSGPAQLMGTGRQSYAPVVMLSDHVLMEIKKNLTKKSSKSQVKRLSRKSEAATSKIPKPAVKKSPPAKGGAKRGKPVSVKGSPASEQNSSSPKSKRGRKPKAALDESAQEGKETPKKRSSTAKKSLSPSTTPPKTQKNTEKKRSPKQAAMPSPTKQKSSPSSEGDSPSHLHYLRSVRRSPALETTEVPLSSRKPRKSVDSLGPTSSKRSKMSELTEKNVTEIKSRRLTVIGMRGVNAEISTPLKTGEKRKLDVPDVEPDDSSVLPVLKKRNAATMISENKVYLEKNTTTTTTLFATPLDKAASSQSVTRSVGRPRKNDGFLIPSNPNVNGGATGAAVVETMVTTSSSSSVLQQLGSEPQTQVVKETATLQTTRRQSVGRGRKSVNAMDVTTGGTAENQLLSPRVTRSTRRTQLEIGADVVDSSNVSAANPETSTAHVQQVVEAPKLRRCTCVRFCQYGLLLGLPAIVAVGAVVGSYSPELLASVQNSTATAVNELLLPILRNFTGFNITDI